jgi:RNA polymerase sigma-70 factor (ECF subfamily)
MLPVDHSNDLDPEPAGIMHLGRKGNVWDGSLPAGAHPCQALPMLTVDWATEFDLNRNDLARFLRARVGSHADAEDLLNDLYLKVDRLPQTTAVGNPRSYLFAMANRLVLDRVREARRRSVRERIWSDSEIADPGARERDCAPNPEEAAIAAQEALQVREAISVLPPRARRVLVLHKIEGASHREIADRLGISRSAVEKHMAVAMKHLRKQLGRLR